MMACLAAGLLAADARNSSQPPISWNQKAAAAYLDGREAWWMTWPKAARDHETFCVSCHTVLPYALSRPTLHSALAEPSASVNEQKLIDNVTTRVRLWKDVEPWYSDEKVGVHKTRESRGTESVLDALVLSSHDAQTGTLSADTRLAFDNMWARQLQTGDEKGSWFWIQFNNEPWEAFDSQYYGAALAAIAVGTAPQNYRSRPEIQTNLAILRQYLSAQASKQSSLNRMILLWVSAKLAETLEPDEKQSIVKEVLSKQQEDGGWSLTSLVGPWKRHDGTALETTSDGYATGLAVYALEQAGITRKNLQLNRGLSWLANHQDKTEGRWLAYSLNKKRDPSSDPGPFMNDAATAYAVLALTQAR
jgi:squalene-hopene/tetraprenyl-beta-curcumene cyclase